MEYYFSLGTNIGNRCENLKTAITYLHSSMDLLAVSSVYETIPVGMPEQTTFFYNLVIKAKSSYKPDEILEIINEIEKQMGRNKKRTPNSKIYEDRIIDIDILLAENLIVNNKNLNIPHKEMINRAFVLIPLCEINKSIIHPKYQKPVSGFLKFIDESDIIRKIDCKNIFI
jgi:2-amino-4-hydroxy-6-hydroxymethyldihydropteridine diphosphokinase